MVPLTCMLAAAGFGSVAERVLPSAEGGGHFCDHSFPGHGVDFRRFPVHLHLASDPSSTGRILPCPVGLRWSNTHAQVDLLLDDCLHPRSADHPAGSLKNVTPVWPDFTES